MFFRIDPHNGVPIYDQIVRQVTYAVAAGSLQPGDRLPSVRELSGRLAVNPNTVARACRDLQEKGLVRSLRGTGLEVTPEAKDLSRGLRLQYLRVRLRDVFVEAHQSQLEPEALRQLIDEELAAAAANREEERS